MAIQRAFRFIHTADTHLGINQPRYRTAKDWYRSHDFMKNFEILIDRVKKEDIDFVIHAGDLFNRSKPPASVVKKVIKLLFEVALLKPVIIIPGNHERSVIKTGLAGSFSQIHVFNRPGTIDLLVNGYSVSLSGFPNIRDKFPQKFNNLLDQTRYNNRKSDYRILVMHQLLESAKVGRNNFTFDRRNPETLLLSRLPREFDYIALGHVHRFQRLYPRHIDVPVIYPGSIERASFAETHEKKGYLVVDVYLEPGKKGSTRTSFMKLPTRPMFYFELNIKQNVANDDIITEIGNKIETTEKESLIYIKITGKVNETLWTDINHWKKYWIENHLIRHLKIKTIPNLVDIVTNA
ncbi:MAG: metallophosphoesterase family protein [Candidatus Hodarchaeales archaeon]